MDQNEVQPLVFSGGSFWMISGYSGDLGPRVIFPMIGGRTPSKQEEFSITEMVQKCVDESGLNNVDVVFSGQGSMFDVCGRIEVWRQKRVGFGGKEAISW
eukprot:gene3512-6160_t